MSFVKWSGCGLLVFVFSSSGGAVAQTQLTRGPIVIKLQEGNDRWVAGKPLHANLDAARRKATATEQKPIATVLACSDSRVPVEAIFDLGIGDLVVVRVYGNVTGPSEIASIEQGVGYLGTPMLIVLGHSSCSAAEAAIEKTPPPGALGELIGRIKPSVEDAQKGNPHLQGKYLLPAVVKFNVRKSMENLLRNSAEVRKQIADLKLTMVGGIYDLETGKIDWLGAHPDQTSILQEAAGEKKPANPGEPKKDR